VVERTMDDGAVAVEEPVRVRVRGPE
jgi:hypothetical protein